MSSKQTLYALIKQLAEKKIKIWLENDTLKFKAPQGALDAELKNQMIAQKPELISFLKEQAQSALTISARPNINDLPISNAQQRLWFIEQYSTEQGAYNIPVAMRLKGNLNINALQYAINTLVSRHEVLQTYFENKQGLPLQKKVDNFHCEITFSDFSQLDAQEKEFNSQQVIEENIGHAFTLNQWPLFKLDLVKESESDYVFLATMHHIIADGWSMSVLIKEIAQYYQSYLQNGDQSLNAHPLQYADFAYWQRDYLNEERSRSLLSFWNAYLKNSAVLELPLDKKRLPKKKSEGRHYKFSLGADLQLALNAFANKQGVTLFMLLSAGFTLLLQRFAQQDDISIGIPIANRNRPEWESMIGFFVNTLVLRSDLSGDPNFSDFLKQVQENTLAIYSKQDMPFDRLVEELSEQRDSNYSPLFQVMFSLQNTPGEQKIQLDALAIEVLENSLAHSRNDMTWNLTEHTQGIDIDLEYNSALFKESTVGLYLKYFEYLLKDIISQKDQAISAYRLQDSDDILKQIRSFNPQTSDYPRNALISEVFDDVAAQYKNAIAISENEVRITYQELADSVDNIAAYLLSKNVQVGDRVIIALQRSVDMTKIILAVLKVGACYVPVDPDYPDERKSYIQNDSQAKLIVSLKSKATTLAAFDKNISDFVFLEDVSQQVLKGLPALENKGMLPACIFYTSGSTGEPKGVIIPHRAILRLVCGTNFAPYSASDVVAHISNVCFDAASMEIWGALLNGGRLHIIQPEILLSAKRFAEELAQHNISIMFLTMGLFRVYANENPRMFSGLNTLLIGGEAVDLNAARKVLESGFAPRQLVNGYGPTENTTFSACHLIDEVSEQTLSAPLGKAIANSQVYITNSKGQLLPAGIAGELVCAGDGLALAYLNKEKLTQEKFMDTYIHELPNERVYLSGDLARYSPEGEIILSGRLDEQIKLRGYRIEPGEIEYVLENLASVEACSVVLKENKNSERFLVAYLVFSDKSKKIDDEKFQTVKAEAKSLLPNYMLPSFFVAIDKLPLNANGKVDKRALPDPDWQTLDQNDYLAPRNELEEKLSDIWSGLLAIDKPSIKANFFDLGGHSLLATQMVSRIYDQFAIVLKVKEVFEHANIEALAALLKTKNSLVASSSLGEIEVVDRSENHVLSKAQQRLWFIHQMDKDSSAYGMPMAVCITGALDVQRLEVSLANLIKRHESLRTRFIVENNEARQVIDVAQDVYTLSVRSLASEQEIQAAINHNQQHIFDLEKGPLFTAELIQKSEQDFILLMNMHHIISDGWSMQILQKDLLSIYQAKGEDYLPKLEIQYIDFSVWQTQYLSEEKNAALLSYWQQELAGVAEVLHLPSDRPRPERQSFEGGLVYHQLDASLQERALDFCKTKQVTSFVLGISVYAVLLAKYSQQQDFCIGIPVSGRQQKSLESLIGFFVNGLLIRSDTRARLSVEEFILQMKEKAFAAFAHQDLSADVLIEALAIKPNPRHQPLAQVAFSHQSYKKDTHVEAQIEDVSFEVLASENHSAKYELILSLGDSGESLELACEYASALFDKTTIVKFLQHYEFILEAMLANPQQMLDQISWYSEQDILVELNKGRGEHELFEKAYPLSANQQAIYLDALINPTTLQNSVGNIMELPQSINPELFEQAFYKLQEKRELLRSKICPLDILGEHKIYQAIPKQAAKTFSYHDISDKNIRFSELASYLESKVYCTYDIENDDLYHYSLYKLDENNYATVLNTHHILFDGVSGKVFLEEVAKSYQSVIDKEALNLEADNFSNFISEQNKVLDQKACLDFWQEKSKYVAGLSFDALEKQNNQEYAFLQKEHYLDADISSSIRKFCRRSKITPSIFFKCLYSILIEQYCRPEADFYIKEYAHGRGKGFESSYGICYQQTPFIVPLDLFSESDFDSNLFSALFLHAANFQKQSRQWREFSIQSQADLLPMTGLGFMYNYTHFESSVSFLGEPSKTVFLSPRAEKQVQLFVREHADHFELLLLYGNDYFEDYQFLSRIEHLSQHLINAETNRTRLSLLNEQDKLLMQGMSSETAYENRGKLLSFAPTDNKIALSCGGKQFTYANLKVKSEALASYLLKTYQIKKAQRIALHLPLNENYLVALFAVIKAGASYVPIQVDYPVERIKQIIESAHIQCVLTESVFGAAGLSEAIKKSAVHVCEMDVLDFSSLAIDQELLLKAEGAVDEQQALYSIFTSGSTGLPKGAQVSLEGELNLLSWYEKTLALNENDKSIVISAPGFDLTQKNFFAFLRCGGSLVLPNLEVFDPALIRQNIESHGVTHINCAPSAFYALLEGGEASWQQLSSLRWVVLGGEPILISELKAWYQSAYCKAQIMNSYGPTECTDVVASYILQETNFSDEAKPIPLGSAITNVKLYVINNFNQQVPVGLIGEIAIGGACLGLGYIEQAKLNQEQFIDIEIGTLEAKKKERVYLSGDLGRINAQGELEYIGRKDFQIKLRGQRIELSEIENALRTLEGVRDALVLLQEEKLIAYFTRSITTQEMSEQNILKALALLLPVYMLPSQMIMLDAWPLNANGKIDRKALPKADFSLSAKREIVKPSNDIEQALYDIWCEVLATHDISVHDSFFELGGHSLLATKAVSRLKEHFKIEFPLKALFDLHTIAEIATYIKTLQWALASKDGSNLEAKKNKDAEAKREEGFL